MSSGEEDEAMALGEGNQGADSDLSASI